MKQNGFTILEFMISMFIGMLILGGVIATYISMKSTTRDTMAIGELQETGRLTLSILRRDIEQVGFWGTFYAEGLTNNNTTTLPNPGEDCSGEPNTNNASFPIHTDETNFRSVFAVTANISPMLGCVKNPVQGTDILQVKFLEGREMTPATITNTNRYYFISEQEVAQFVTGVAAQSPLPNANATLWPYSHHVYFIRQQQITVNNIVLNVPVLMRMRLTATGGMIEEPIMEGIEDMRLLFGLDTNNDSRVDTYTAANNMTTANWENPDAVLTLQIFLLVRSIEPDGDLSLGNRTYTLGLDVGQRVHAFDEKDKFRRTVFSTTIRLNNVGATQW